MAFKAAIRAGALKTIGTGRGGIASAESHAKRLDPVAQSRVVQERDPISWSKAESGALDYVEAFKAHKRETGAGERKGADLAIEFKAVVSPDWLAEDGARYNDSVAMEVATTILLLHNAQEHFKHLGTDFAQQVDLMVARLHACIAGRPVSGTILRSSGTRCRMPRLWSTGRFATPGTSPTAERRPMIASWPLS